MICLVIEAAGSGIDGSDHEWIEGLAWAYGLVAPDPVERAAALDRQARARMEVEAALDRLNEGRFPIHWLRFRARDRAYRRACGRCLPGALWSESRYGHGVSERLTERVHPKTLSFNGEPLELGGGSL
ncbi:hypothetical protein SVIOM74S_09458 [Streptomyces violarus]